MNPRSELLRKMNRDMEEYVASKDRLKDDIALRKMGQLAFTHNTSSLFAPITQKSVEESKVLENILTKQEELKQEIKQSKAPPGSDHEVRIPSEDIERVINYYSKIPLKKKSTSGSSNSTTMMVTGTLLNSPLYMLNGRYFNIHNDKLLEIDKENGEVQRIHTISPNIAEILFTPNPLEKQYGKPELGQYLRILQTTGKPLDNAGEKMKSVLSQLHIVSKPKLKDLPQGTGLPTPTVFLPSDPKVLYKRLFVLLGSQKAGNTNVRNEAISIMDYLLEKGFLNKEQYQNLYNEYYKHG
jgi:hypothetical protein